MVAGRADFHRRRAGFSVSRAGQFDAMSGRAAALDRWGKTIDRTAATRPGLDAFLARFAAQADPLQQMTPPARQRAAQALLRAHMIRLARARELARKAGS